MRFSVAAAVAALAAGVVATGAEAEDYTTIVVTEYTTYCPQSTVLTHGSETVSVPSGGIVTLSDGPYTITRPLITSTITRCKACSSAAIPTPSSSASVSVPVIPTTSAPVIPTAPPTVPTGVNPSGTTPSGPVFTGAASRAAVGAGAGLGAVFGLVAYLL